MSAPRPDHAQEDPPRAETARPAAARYGIAILSVALCLLVRLLLTPVLGDDAPLLIFVVAVTVAAWFGGVGPGLLATACSVLAGDYFLLPPIEAFGIARASDGARVGLFCAEGLIISGLTEARRVAWERDARSRIGRQESEEHFRLLVEGVRDYAIYLLDPEGRVASWNAGAERIKGYRVDEILGEHVSRFYPEEDIQQDKPARELEQAARDGQFYEEGWRVRKDGTRFFASVLITALRDEAGNLRGFAKVTRDITERERAEEALRDSLNLLKATTDGTSDAIFVKDGAGRYLLANLTVGRIFGRPVAEVLGRDDTALLPPHIVGPLRENDRHIMASGETQVYEEAVTLASGEVRTYQTTKSPYRDHSGRIVGVIGVGRDITERLRAEQEVRRLNASLERRVAERTRELEQANAALREANQSLGDFSHVVAHDLRAPLRAMQGFGQALTEDYAGALEPEAQEYVARIVGAADRMDTLIADLLAYSRLSRADLPLAPVDLSGVVDEAVSGLEAEVRARGAEVVVEHPLPGVHGHRGTLVQVVTNLVANALKFVAKGVPPRVRIRAEAREDAGGRADVRLWVEDNGIGIAPEHRERIFRVFERLHGIEAYPGTGIGLAIVHKGVERLGGRAGVESREDGGGGSRFWIELPRGENKT